MTTASELIELLGLEPLPDEGGYWAQSWLTDHGSGIYFLTQPGDFSAMHRLGSAELWHFYAGAPACMTLLNPDGSSETHLLGTDFRSGHRPMVVVEPGVWMGCETTGEWTLFGTTMAPAYCPDDFELGSREQLCEQYPAVSAQIINLTRPRPHG